MFNSSISDFKNKFSLIRSLTYAQLWHVFTLVLLSTILPMMLAFGCVSLVFELFDIHSFSAWSLLPVMIMASLSKMLFFAQKIHTQAQQTSGQTVKTHKP